MPHAALPTTCMSYITASMSRSLGMPAQEDAIVLPKRAASTGTFSPPPYYLRHLMLVSTVARSPADTARSTQQRADC